MTRRFTALLLALIITLGIVSMPAMAANDGGWLEDADITEEDFYTEPEEEEEEPEEEPKEKKKPSKKDEEPSIVFTDVPENAWYYDVVMDLVEAKILGGFGDGTFRPANTVTTGQALKMILLASGFEEPAPVQSHWARCFLDLALEAGILQRGEITDLDVNISRALVAKIAALSLGVAREDNEQVFTDTNDDHIMALYEIGILGGYDDNTFRPTQPLTRAELSAIAHRIYAYVDGYEEEEEDEDEDEELADAPELRTSEEALDYIMSVEGFCKEPYWDYQQYSIGYGSRCDPDDYPDGITKKEAELLLRELISDFEAELDKFLKKNKIKLKDHEYDAMISFTYNIGTDWMRSSRLANLLIEDDYSENDFASAFGIWCHVGSSNPQVNSHLVARRIRELQMFLDNDYTGKESDGFVCLYYETDRGEVEVDIAFYREGTEYDPLFSAECEDDEFVGWMTEDGEFLEESDRPREDMTVYAVWESDNW